MSPRILLSLMIATAFLGCAAKQRIGLDCVPENTTLYLDGERLDEIPSELILRSDRPHKLYFKGEDTVPELVILASEEVDGKPRLFPTEICVQPRSEPVRRELTVEIDPGVSADSAAGGEDAGFTVDVEPRPDFLPAVP
jgi:hypothetical protein